MFILGALFTAGIASASILGTPEQANLDKRTAGLQDNPQFQYLHDNAYAQLEGILQLNNISISDSITKDLKNNIAEAVQLGLQYSANSDNQRPSVGLVQTPARTTNGISVPGSRVDADPSVIERRIPINANYDYVLRGKVDLAHLPADWTISAQGLPFRQITLNDLNHDDDGNFVIYVNATEASQSRDHLQISAGNTHIVIRDNIGDWASEKPTELSVQVSNVDPHFPAPTDQTVLDRAKIGTVSNIAQVIALISQFIGSPNTVSNLATDPTFLTRANAYFRYSLTDSNALVLTLQPAQASYWSLPLFSDAFYLLDAPANELTSINSQQAVRNSDGTFTIVIAKSDPGVRNWVSTAGRLDGFGHFFLQGLSSQDNQVKNIKIDSKIVEISDLPSSIVKESASNRAARIAPLQTAYKGLFNL